jgi:dolichol-phosphate mannosyltransferase
MISFVVPAYNEEERISETLDEIIKSTTYFEIKDFEIIVINDYSKDNTIHILNDLNKSIKFLNILKIINNEKNLGFGGSVKRGFSVAEKKYCMMLPGDNAHKSDEIIKMIKFIITNDIDILSTYYVNSRDRKFLRYIFTKLYTPFLNFLFGLNLKYYNGLSIINTQKLKKIRIDTDAHCWQVELWVKFSRLQNFKYDFIPTYLSETKEKTNVFKLTNSLEVMYAILRLFFFTLKSKFF